MQNCVAVDTQTCALAHSLGRGINMGNMLEAPREGDWGIRLDPAFIPLIKDKFTTVRVPVRWTNHAAATEDATLDDFFSKRVDNAIQALLNAGFNVIVNQHHYNQIFGAKLHPNEMWVEPAVLEKRLINIWKQLAQRYKNQHPKLIFELLNEPHGTMKPEAWNALAAEIVEAIRRIDPDRVLMVGPTDWNSPRDLHKLRVPKDKKIIVSIHDYSPFNFTHQGISWMPHLPRGVTCCNHNQINEMRAMISLATQWNQKHGYPLHLGEFGSYQAADMPSREIYTRTMRDLLENKGIGWAYWEFGSTFGMYDPKKSTWIEPIRRALLDN